MLLLEFPLFFGFFLRRFLEEILEGGVLGL
jgi:hypothetical protein